MMQPNHIIPFFEKLKREPFAHYEGKVLSVQRDSLLLFMPCASVGMILQVVTAQGPVLVEVVALRENAHVAMPLDDLTGVQLGDKVFRTQENFLVPIGDQLLGRVIDSLGEPYDEGGPFTHCKRIELSMQPWNPLKRKVISMPFDLGIRSLNALVTCGLGQRLGILAGSGVGKSVLLGMMARYCVADVVVIALVGERGRELKEFLENEVGIANQKKCVVVVETSDRSAVRRVRAPWTALTIAESFARQGKQVLFMMDSLTRFAMAYREMGLAAGEAPTSKAYPASTYSALSKLIERGGIFENSGAITSLFTVLVEGDDLEDPIADSARSYLDGHIVLSRKLAEKGVYPAIDILSSISRTMDQVVSSEQQNSAREIKNWLSKFYENEDAYHYGMYTKGTDAEVDRCLELAPRIFDFLKQPREERVTLAHAINELTHLLQ